MGRSRRPAVPPTVTAGRAGRLYKLLLQVERTARPRDALLRKLKVDVRGFYRDLELLRELGIGVASDGERYQLEGELDDALGRLPFPDPGLSLRDALKLAQGRTEAHRKLRGRITAFLGPKTHVPTGPAA